MKQVKLKQDDGLMTDGWIDKTHAIMGRRIDLKLGDGERSPIMTVITVWDTERDIEDILDRRINQKGLDQIMWR